ncbi:MAG TPA: hypothetical protein VLE72_03430 [Candidatus Saccharimonadales bacterium]|nr:hypothetical protein [Candidatus Saccharimonadales bacterium]
MYDWIVDRLENGALIMRMTVYVDGRRSAASIDLVTASAQCVNYGWVTMATRPFMPAKLMHLGFDPRMTFMEAVSRYPLGFERYGFTNDAETVCTLSPVTPKDGRIRDIDVMNPLATQHLARFHGMLVQLLGKARDGVNPESRDQVERSDEIGVLRSIDHRLGAMIDRSTDKVAKLVKRMA